MKRIFIGALAALAMTAGAAASSAFFGWRVAGVGAGDLLYARAYPSSSSRIQAGYANRTNLSLTGRCTGGLHMDTRWFSGLGWSGKRAAVRNRWCEIWHEPRNDGNFRSGWVYGKYIAPL